MASHFQQKITPIHHFFDFNLAEVWAKRHLLWALVCRDLQVRYKNTALGVFWVVLQPLLSTLIFTLVFSSVFKFNLSGENYLVYTLVGFIFWQFFSGSILTASGSIYEQIGMIKKIYFPRLFLPLTIIFRSLFDFFIAAIFLILAMIFNKIPFSLIGLAGFFAGLLITFILICGLSFFLSSLNARYRDFRHLVPFIFQIWFYATPVFYATSLLNENLPFLAIMNPMAQILSLVRNAIFSQTFSWITFGILFIVSLIVFIFGLAFFKKMEVEMVDWT